MQAFSKSELTYSQAMDLWDDDGFIDIDKCRIHHVPGSRETRGTPDRRKEWVEFADGQKCMIRGEWGFMGLKNFGVYSEIIMEEFAKACGIKSAHYELAKWTENGKTIEGIMTKSFLEDDVLLDLSITQKFMSVYDITGQNPNEDTWREETDYDWMIKAFYENLIQNGISAKKAENLRLKLNIRQILGISTLKTDEHLKNIGLIFYHTPKSKAKVASLAPAFDCEAALLLDTDINIARKVIDTGIMPQIANAQVPKVSSYSGEKDYSDEEMWKGTAKKLLQIPEVATFYKNKILPIDIEKIVEKAEERSRAIFPDEVYELAIGSYLCRKKEITREFVKELENTVDRDAFQRTK